MSRIKKKEVVSCHSKIVVKKELRINISSHEEGLRALARIIARTYMRDMREKTAKKDAKQSQTEGREKDPE
ncbi:MAG: hypothetical protein WC562_05315 [Dehalococcoidia bacterium]|jgi:hypothetical protein